MIGKLIQYKKFSIGNGTNIIGDTMESDEIIEGTIYDKFYFVGHYLYLVKANNRDIHFVQPRNIIAIID